MNKVENIINSYDGSYLEFIPKEVFYPKSAKDVKKIINLANKTKTSIHPKGHATSVAGNSLGPGYIINFSKYMNKILKISKNYIDVEPGLTANLINLALKNHFFPVDPSSFNFCSIGGMVMNNASGLHSLKYGVTKDYVLGLEGYYADGSFFSTIKNYNTNNKVNKLNKIYSNFIKNKNSLPLTLKTSSGYNLELKNQNVDLNKLLCGSEGTLLIITKIRLKILPKFKNRDTLLILFKNINLALTYVENLKNHSFSSLELLDTKLIKLCKKHYPATKDFFIKNYNAGIIAEIDDNQTFTKILIKKHKNIKNIKIIKAKSKLIAEKILYLRKAASPILNRISSKKRPLRIIEDIIVPISKIKEFYYKQKIILKKYKLDTVFFGHIGEGHFHINPSINTNNYLKTIKKLAYDSYLLTKNLNGSIAGEHGDGYIRTPYIKKLYPNLYNTYKSIKKVFDPKNLLNPNKIVNPIDIKYKNSKYKKYTKNISFNNILDKCTGCNMCLNFCKSYMTKQDEKFKTRGRIYILKGFLDNKLNISDINNFVYKCEKCGKCEKNCPTGIDMPKLILKFKKELKNKEK